MNNNNLTNEENFRRFLLGEMQSVEREKFEETFITDENLFENLRVAEDELIESYVRGTLDLSAKSKFETNFLTTEKRKNRVEFTRLMLAKLKANKEVIAASNLETISIFDSFFAIFKQPTFAFGSAFAILAVIVGGWFLLKNQTQISPEIAAKSPTPIVKTSPTNELVNVNQTPNLNVNQTNSTVNNSSSNKPETNANVRKEPEIRQESSPELAKEIENNLKKQDETEVKKEPEQITPKPAKPVISTLALFVGGVRGEGKTNELNLPKNSNGANLQLNLESQDYKFYNAEIVDENGKVIYRSGKLSAKNSKINAFVSSKNLKRGDYIIKLYGKNSANQDESVADYQFRVNQK